MSDRDSADIFGDFEKNQYSDEDDVIVSKRQGKVATSGVATDDENGVKTSGKSGPTKTKKFVRNIQLKLDPNRICGPRGITAVAANFQGVTLRGKDHEKADLDVILSKMEHWAHRLFPKLPFEDCVEQIAKLGNNRSVQVHMKRFRMDIGGIESEKEDESITTDTLFDNTNRPDNIDPFEAIMETSLNLQQTPKITQDQQNRMAENKRKAEEKRASRLLLNMSQSHSETFIDNSSTTSDLNVEKDEEVLDIDMFLEKLPQNMELDS